MRTVLHAVAFFVPWPHGARVRREPGACGDDRFARGHERVDDAERFSLLRSLALALQHHHERRLHADHPRQTLRAAGARQEPDLSFGQTQLNFRIVGQRAVMARQSDFEAAAQRQPFERDRDRFAARLQSAERLVEREHPIERRLQIRRGLVRADLAEIGAGAKAALFAGREDDAFDRVVALHRLHDLREIAHHALRDRVHRPAGHVERDERYAVAVDLNLEVFHFFSPIPSMARRAHLKALRPILKPAR